MVSEPKLNSFSLLPPPLHYFFPRQQPMRAKGIPSPLLPFFCCPCWAATAVLGRRCHRPYWVAAAALIGSPPPPFLAATIAATPLGTLLLPFRAPSTIVVTLFKATAIRPYFFGFDGIFSVRWVVATFTHGPLAPPAPPIIPTSWPHISSPVEAFSTTRHSITSQLTRPTYTFDGHNYASWATGFEDFLIAHRLLHHLTESSPARTSPDYDTWNQLDFAIRSWMCQSILPTSSQPLSRLKPASTLWRTLETMYANKTNISRTVEIFESMFTCTQGDQSLQDHFGRLQSLVQELSLYQPPTTDLRTLERYREELIAGVYLSGLRPSIASQIHGQVLSGTQVPDMTSIFSSALRVSTGVTLSARVTSSTGPSSSTSFPLPESSALLVSGTRGREGGRNSKATTSRGGRPSAKGKKIFSPCTYCGKTTHASEKCWKEFGKPEWDQAMFSSTTPSPTPPSISTPSVGPTIQMTFSLAEYEAWKQSLASTLTANLASTSGTHAFLAPRSSWVIDSGASAHMTGTPF